jgi:hypothetical protein
VRLAPGISLNISKRSLSASIGAPGGHVTIGGHHPPRLTAGLPGSGSKRNRNPRRQAAAEIRPHHHFVFLFVVFALAAHLLGWF